MSRLMLVDFSQIAHASYHIAVKSEQNLETQDEKFGFWRHIMLNMLMKQKNKYKPTKIILCLDHRSWRKKEFLFYKAKRDVFKNSNPAEYQDFCELIETFTNEIDKFLSIGVVKHEGAEADDVIAILTHKNHHLFESIVIVSGDKDFQQLMLHKNVILHNQTKDVRVICKDPAKFRMHHILHGDPGDGVPNILSDDDTFVNENKRQKNCGDKKIDAILAEGIDEFLQQQTEEIQKNYKRNYKLIDLSLHSIPEDLVKPVCDQYLVALKKKTDFMKVLQFLRKYSLRSFYNRVNEFIF